ncbi:MAG TPA: ClpXP protease specificity-enhancing factor SspB [Acetobacteraceae bacterium]|nr:ClpXP protease specificity-enhancing factor SspB [Acetobacteraceae bacterium]
MTDEPDEPPESLLPYETWTEEALRLVAVRALQHAAAHGLPGEHHFYLSFRTDHPGVDIPARLRAQYPQEMTIVLQHQFWDLAVDEAAGLFRVGLSFSSVPSMLTVPFAAMTGFADPFVRYGLRFQPAEAAPPAQEQAAEPPPAEAAESQPAGEEAPQVVSLDAFRRRSTPKD